MTEETKWEIKRDGHGRIWSEIRQIWLFETPEETVRQKYVQVLHHQYGYSFEQMEEEVAPPASRGTANARADILIWRTVQERTDGKTPLIVVECKADNVTIDDRTYQQGANYAQYERALFFVTHNNRETKYWKVDLGRRMPNFDEIEDIPLVDAGDKEIEELISKLKVFKEDEFANLLHKCHNIIRNREKKDPAAAFDEIAKILFIKVLYERRLKRQGRNLFSRAFLEEQRQLYNDPIDVLFRQTKEAYEADQIFDPDEKVNLRYATVLEIVKQLESYNLSDTSEDIKGIAFERFLGRTFRGEIGQFFTPRPIVEFMIRMVEPQEGEVICDPAVGSGGFLIRFFEIVRQQILADVDRQYDAFRAEVMADESLSEAEQAKQLSAKYEQLQQSVDQSLSGSRLWKLANRCIYGCDANERMARTSKMNMIMHGDGHGGVHHSDGFINVNGIFEQRFDIVLTNPPFGSSVETSDKVLPSYGLDGRSRQYQQYAEIFGDLYVRAQGRIRAARDKSIATLFDLGKDDRGKAKQVKTEILFIERCLSLLKPGGRLGIVLPEGVFNNPTLAYVREYCEDRAYIRAVVSLPADTFKSSGASVKASLLFVQKFTVAEQARYDEIYEQAKAEILAKQQVERDTNSATLAERPKQSDFYPKGVKKPTAEQKKAAKAELAAYREALRERKRTAKARLKELDAELAEKARQLLKERFSYPIFMYEAERVGITATGEEDQNELYPNDNQPADIDTTCLEIYHQFRNDPASFLIQWEQT